MNDNPVLQFTFMKVLLIGDADVGKSDLMCRFAQDSFNSDTVG